MWTIIKIDITKISLFKIDLKNKVGNNFKIYYPKFLINKIVNNKAIKKEYALLGDYIFCFHKDFKEAKFIDHLKYLKGVKYFLNGHIDSQEEISFFIKQCKSQENEKGHLTQNFYDLILNSSYQFKSGVFSEKIFKLIEMQKNEIKILINDMKVKIKNKKEFLIFNHN